jgi:uncharacterized protein YciI
MQNLFAFYYSMKFEPHALKTAIPAHIAYWEKHAPDNFFDGPFKDRSGGLVIFPAADQAMAEDICRNDPYVTEGLVTDFQVREWLMSHRR